MIENSSKKNADFFSTPRTLTDVSKFLKRKKPVTGIDVHKLPLPSGYAWFEQHDEKSEPFFLAMQERNPNPKRIWKLWSSKRHPYMWVQFPRNIPHNKIKIVPLSDVHYGAHAHDSKRFVEYLKWIEATPEVFTFLNGDILENAIDGSVGGAIYESALNPDEQIWGSRSGHEPGIIELLRPIAHKVLWAQPGNHEWRSWKKVNIDPMKIVCRELNIPYFNEPIYADVLAWGHRFTFYCHHGVTGSMTKGGKLNAAMRPASFQESVSFIIMGHVHDSMVNDTTRIVRKRKFDAHGKLESFKLEESAQYVMVCPSFMEYFDSYGSRAGYSPGSWGSVSCTLFQDGTYRAGE